LNVSTAGARSWRMNYTYGRNAKGTPIQKTLTFGLYPALSLVEARGERDKAKKLLREGKDPAIERKVAAKAQAADAANTFQSVGELWFELKSGWSLEKFRAWRKAHDGKWVERDAHHWMTATHGGWSIVHAGDVIESLEADIFPAIGDLPISAVKAPKLLEVLQVVEKRGAIETAHRLRQRASAIFVYGIGTGACEADPAASLGKALKQVPKSKPQPSIMDGIRNQDERLAAVRKMMLDCEAERCRAGTKLALRLIALTAVRPNELHKARWEEFTGLDGDEPAWTIPASRMKGDKDRKEEENGEHIVPLARQAVDVLVAARELTGHLDLVFPSERHVHRPMSADTLRSLLIRAGYFQRHVPHGFRAAFSTYMNDRADREWRAAGNVGASPDRSIIDLMLAHVPIGTSGSEGSYNRADYLPRRRELAQEWADILLEGFCPAADHLGKPIRYAATGPGRVQIDGVASPA
jgi:integrase